MCESFLKVLCCYCSHAVIQNIFMLQTVSDSRISIENKLSNALNCLIHYLFFYMYGDIAKKTFQCMYYWYSYFQIKGNLRIQNGY